MRTTFSVPTVSCQHCKEKITSALSSQPGVRGTEVDLETKAVTVEHDEEVPVSRLASLISEAGYEVSSDEALA